MYLEDKERTLNTPGSTCQLASGSFLNHPVQPEHISAREPLLLRPLALHRGCLHGTSLHRRSSNKGKALPLARDQSLNEEAWTRCSLEGRARPGTEKPGVNSDSTNNQLSDLGRAT